MAIGIIVTAIIFHVNAQSQYEESQILSPRLQQLRNTTFDQLSLKEGLPNATVSMILQDRRGFMWFVTQGGLCRYDGHQVRVFESKEADSATISSSNVYSICEDRTGRIWIGGGGLNAYDPTTGEFRRYMARAGDTTSLSDPIVRTLYEDHAGHVWIGTSHGLNRISYLPDGNVNLVRFKSNRTDAIVMSDKWVDAISEDESGCLWIGTWGGLYRYDPREDRILRVGLDRERTGTKGYDLVVSLTRSKDGILWVGTHEGLVRLDPKTLRSKRYSNHLSGNRKIPALQIFWILEDRQGVLWLGTLDAGLIAFDPETEEYLQFVHNPGNPRSLCNNSVQGLFEDDHGSLWVGTYGGGISKIDRNRKQFLVLTHEPGNPNSLSHNNVGPILEDNQGNIWIGTYGNGVDVLDRRQSHFTHYSHNDGNNQSLSHNYVTSIYQDARNSIWITTLNGLNRFEPSMRSFARYYSKSTTNASNDEPMIWAVHQDSDGRYWAGSALSLSRIDQLTKLFEAVLPIGIISLLDDKSTHCLWLGTVSDGLVKFNTRTLETTKFVNNPDDSSTISHNTVFTLCRDYADPERVLWAGTDKGLNRFDKITGKFRRFTESDGLPGGFVTSMAFDKRGRLWIGTAGGLSVLNTQTNAIRNYDAQDGIQGNESGQFGLCLATSGEMFYSGSSGVTIFHPDSIHDNPHMPSIVLTDFRITNRSVIPARPNSPLSKTITETKEITLSYLDNMISFEFAALDYTMPSKNQYAYRMEEFDKDWIQSGNVNTATYTNLDPGKYTFRVKGSNNDGVGNEKGASVTVIITPPWWKTLWAYCAYIVLIAGILYSIYRLRVNRLQLSHELQLKHLEAEKMHEVDSMKSRFFTNVSHEFRTPLTLVLGPVEQMLSRTNDEWSRDKLSIVKRSAEKLRALINELLDFSKIEAGNMRLAVSKGEIVRFVCRIAQSFQPWAERKKISLRCDNGQESVQGFFDGEKVEKILNNLISNALKFTPEGGEVTVSAHRRMDVQMNFPTNDGCIEITVSDTGPGIAPEHLPHIFERFYRVDETHRTEGTGIGLALASELAELHHGSINVWSAVGKGTSFALLLPLDGYSPDEIVEADTVQRYESPADDIYDTAETLTSSEEVPESHQTTVLLVEDNADVRAYVKEALAPEHSVIEARDGIEGLEKARSAIPDLVVSDIMMPAMDGYELCRELKRDERTSHIPVILLTAKAGSADIVEGYETGADAYVVKPFAPNELAAQVQSLIEGRRKLREQFSKGVLLKPGEVSVASLDDAFLQKAISVVVKHIADEHFSVEEFAAEVCLSRTQLHRKIKAITNLAPTDFIRLLRLQRAAELLAKNAGTVSEIAYRVGFASPSHFTRCFHQQFGCLPTDMKKNHPKNSSTSASTP